MCGEPLTRFGARPYHATEGSVIRNNEHRIVRISRKDTDG